MRALLVVALLAACDVTTTAALDETSAELATCTAPSGCALGCIEDTCATPAHCAYVVPSYRALADACTAPAALPSLVVTASQTWDTGIDALCTGGVVTQLAGPPICVVRYAAIEIAASATLTATGSRALALVADSQLRIAGVLDASASGTTNGPGGGLAQHGGTSISLGQGGAGFRTFGGPGGGGGGSNGGPPLGDPANHIALIGGPRGAIGASGFPIGGGGGGAVALIACRGGVEIPVGGTVDIGGGGGRGGSDALSGGALMLRPGGGGGAGGNLVIEGGSVAIAGAVFANGGGGGGGTTVNDGAGFAGSDGPRATWGAAGGAGTGSGGLGGTGAATGAAGVGGTGSWTGAHGGGGGAAGYIQTYTPAGVAPLLAPSAASPAISLNRTVELR